MLPLRNNTYRKTYQNPQHTNFQRPGTLGVDHDELGAEMGPNARVWHKYVEESDRMDIELVDGWNKTLDVMLIFAALFSAISTAFVIESSKGLKPDPAETSGQLLLTISQTLLAMSTPGSSVNSSSTRDAGSLVFNPTRSTIIVNALWFTSLSLSVAVSLICILAKEWCYSFMTGRIGPVLQQARLRHRRWASLESWKMKEVLAVLPLLMHAALLLFAIGLSVYLWDINRGVALPVVIISTLATLFYVVTALLASIFWLCPYTTTAARLVNLLWNTVLQSRYIRKSLTSVVAYFIRMFDDDSYAEYRAPGTRMRRARRIVSCWSQPMNGGHPRGNTTLGDSQTPMDSTTSSMLSWMIINCEDSRSVDLALQALAGADPLLLPRLPLWECNGVQLVAERLRSCLDAIQNLGISNGSSEYHKLLEIWSQYSRSFRFLINHIHGEGYRLRRTEDDRLYFEFDTTNRALSEVMNDEVESSLFKVFEDSNALVERCLHQSISRFDLAAFDLNNLLFAVEANRFHVTYHSPRHNDTRWIILQQHLARHELVTLPQSALIALISGITKSYLCMYQSYQHPDLLVDLLTASPEAPALHRAIGICLTILAFKYCNHPRASTIEHVHRDRIARVREAYIQLNSREYDPSTTPTLLKFGLLSLLDCDNYTFSCRDGQNEAIGGLLQTLAHVGDYGFHIPTAGYTDRSCKAHIAHILSGWSKCEGRGTNHGVPQLLCLIDHVIKVPDACSVLGDTVAKPLAGLSISTSSYTLKRACLQGMIYCLGLNEVTSDGVLMPFFKVKKQASVSSQVCDALATVESSDLIKRLYQLTMPTHLDPEITPYVMHFMWGFIDLVLYFYGHDLLYFPRLSLSPFFEFEAPSNTVHAPDLPEEYSIPIRPPSSDDMMFSSVWRRRRSYSEWQVPSDFTVPPNICEMDVASLWIPSLVGLCQSHPENLLDSQIFDEMIASFAKTSPNSSPSQALLDTVLSGVGPQAEGANDASPSTWIQILQNLKHRCENAPLQDPHEEQQDTGTETGVPGEAQPSATTGTENMNDEATESENAD